MRVFRVDRVLQVVALHERFERPRDFDSVEHLARSLANVPWGIEIEVLLKTTLVEARSRISAHWANLTETEDGIVMRSQADDLQMAARYLVGVGFDFVVVRPDELRNEVQRVAQRLLELTEAMPAV
jgi:predicted DNA-binding transcriptional regulator YafY